MGRLTIRPSGIVLALLFSATACAGRRGIPPLAPLPFLADTVRSELVADGVTRRYIYSAQGPWAIHVLDIQLDRCTAAVAVKGVDSAAARIKTTDMLAVLGRHATIRGGVNADFFSLKTGEPTGLLIVDGHQLTRPSQNPVLAVDSAGTARIIRFAPGKKLVPFYPRDAVGGRQMLVDDSVIQPNLDSAGGVTFGKARHPRTSAGVAHDGHRLLLAVVDGRQAPYSDGMSLNELASLMLALGRAMPSISMAADPVRWSLRIRCMQASFAS
jgi:Exopolysaccharide biosynthesis protein related to N-acetylglucosamine-1-phosphodiester alpha-N-acetylglucosaminidase